MQDPGADAARAKDKDIDYTSGSAVSTRIAVDRAQNPQEAKLALEKYYGPGNYGQDRFNNWWVRENGKRVSVYPSGSIGSMAANFGTALAGQRWEAIGGVAGTILGGIGGEALFPAGGGVPGGIAGQVAGQVAGKAVDDTLKWAEGLFSQTPEEVVTSLALEAGVSLATGLAGPAARYAGGRPLKWVAQKWTGVTPETKQMAQEIMVGLPTGEKGVPPVRSYAPGATSMEYHRQAAELLSGPSTTAATKQNILYLEARLRNALTAERFSPQDVAEIIAEAKAGSAAVSSTKAGTAVSVAGTKIHADMMNDFDAKIATAKRTLAEQEKALREWVATAAPQLGHEVVIPIVEQRLSWSKQMAAGYKVIDKMTGDKKSVPTLAIRTAAKELVDITPPSLLPPIIKSFVGKGAPNWITFEKAHALRTALRELADTEGVAPTGVSIGRLQKMASAADHAISNAQGIKGEKAVAALKAMDNLYAKGVAIWHNAEINRLVKSIQSGIIPEPGKIASMFMKHDNVELAKAVLNMIPPEIKEQVVKADLGNMIAATSHLAKDGRYRVDGKAFFDTIQARKKLIQTTYPPDAARDVERYAYDVAVYDGQVEVAAAQDNPSQIVDLLKQAATDLRAAQIFAEEDPVGALRGGTPAQIDRAMSVITKPKAEATTVATANTLGINSPEWWEVRKYAMQQLFSKMFEPLPSMERRISGPSLQEALKGYTAKQQELLFPGGLLADMQLLAKEAHFLFPLIHPDVGLSQHVAAIKGGMPLRTLHRYLWAQLGGWFANHPRVVKFLTSEIRTNPLQARGIMSLIGQTVLNNWLLAGPGSDQPGPDVPRTQRQPLRSVQPGLSAPSYGGIGEQ